MTTPPRAVIKRVQWTLSPDKEPDAEPLTYAMKCVVCSDGSPRSEEWDQPQSWALAHSGENPSHHTYRETITRPWRTWMNT